MLTSRVGQSHKQIGDSPKDLQDARELTLWDS